MKKLFDSGNVLWRAVSRLADYMMLSLCWLLCSLPLVTLGATCTALYDCAAHCFHDGEEGMFRRFFRTLKNELGRGVLISLVWGVLAAVLYIGYQVLYQQAAGSTGWTVFSLVYLCSLFIPLATLSWVICVNSRFAYPFGTLHRNAFIFAFAHLSQSIVMVVTEVMAVILTVNLPFLIVILPAALAHLHTRFVEKVLHKYMPKED